MDTDVTTIQARIEKLERANRRLQLAGVAVLILAAAGLLSANRHSKSEIIEARQFLLRDARGQARGGLIVTAEGPALELYDASQKLRLNLSISGDMPNLTLKDGNGTGVLVLADVPAGPGLMLYDRLGNPRVQLDVAKSGPRLFLEDEKGFSTTVGSYFTGDPKTDEKLRAASVVLAQKDLGVLWRAPQF
jgi:hypothetical protein